MCVYNGFTGIKVCSSLYFISNIELPSITVSGGRGGEGGELFFTTGLPIKDETLLTT